MKMVFIGALVVSLAASAPGPDAPRRSEAPPSGRLDLKAKINVPVILCIDDNPTLGGQPSAEAYAKAATHGFRSVLTLRAPKDGIDGLRERFLVENNQMRYFNISTSAMPSTKQIELFLQLARDPANHPMLINCAFAERMGPYMMIFRIVEQGWSEDKAIEEAGSLGLGRETLRSFARPYIKGRLSK